MYSRRVNGSLLEIVQGDITQQEDVEAVVNAANALLMPGGGVAGAIHRTAGPELMEECRPLAPIAPGEAVLTRAYNLPNKYIIHCLGPVYGQDQPADQLLANCYRKAMQIAAQKGIQTIAFPAISTGAFGYPLQEAVEIAIPTVLQELTLQEKIRLARFVLFSKKDLEVHRKELDRQK